MKKSLVTMVAILVVPLALAGCSTQSNNQDTSKSSSSSNSQTAAESDSQSSSVTTANNSNSPRALKVQYQDESFTTTLDHEYYEEHLYKYVPGSVDRNKTYSWDSKNVSSQTKVHVDKRAIATFKDEDDHEAEHETFFRIKIGNHANQKYWVSDDALQDDHENDFDD
ncbi:hypothetical protein [Lentilactobacillus kisonensis]|uniref:Lipoprotein n=2 Tax=Lentilactobacillus kisonensis TaxID=481722 RepID=H1LE53_9LACO|nr:hypothetical protein [Lentilactobacillus kisonensis]EHO52739.1 hypothetical protein HMPREF9104_00879 [Lentilactobacillus kisonensis F0435]KRL22579.1 hypothetical protein FC98_GL002175 [Lentilactobacillus kisonensis DSM 19906 = JCM 15041]